MLSAFGKIFKILVVALIAYLIGQGIGEEIVRQLRSTGGVVMASDIMLYQTVMPIGFAIGAGYIVYLFTKDK